LRIAVISLDDFYLKHEDQVSLAKSQPSNPLVQHRGQPATHDLDLLIKTLTSLQERQPTSLPSYDKSQFAGAGDRAPETSWTKITTPLDVLILEGWCVGFKALPDGQLKQKWETAVENPEIGQLGRLKFEDVEFVNDALWEYGNVWDRFDAFVHIDAAQTEWVYDWRLEAEVKMRELRGVENAMSDAKVRAFVDGCKCMVFSWLCRSCCEETQ
jgi:D-glycerate 3-kinase